MKRNIKRTPGFDEIIFENRNKTYGAYDLRKRYKSVTTLSVLMGVFIGISLVLSLSFTIEEPVPRIVPVNNAVPVIDFIIEVPVPEIPKMPKGLDQAPRNYQPVVTEDTAAARNYIPTTDELIANIPDRNVNDTSDSQPDPVIEDIIPKDNEPRIVVKEMPEFPGGAEELLKYIAKNINYPADAIEKNLQGKVFLKFVVNADGSVDRISVTRGIDPLLDDEAVRVISSLPRFRPGRQNGTPVPVWFSIPVSFQLRSN